jgi:CO dehydrogenase nickel-insertion accessory protein CooC1
MKAITTDQKIKELKTELGFRHAVYSNKVKAGSMTKELMQYKIQVIEEIISDYEQNKPVVQQAKLFEQ